MLLKWNLRPSTFFINSHLIWAWLIVITMRFTCSFLQAESKHCILRRRVEAIRVRLRESLGSVSSNIRPIKIITCVYFRHVLPSDRVQYTKITWRYLPEMIENTHPTKSFVFRQRVFIVLVCLIHLLQTNPREVVDLCESLNMLIYPHVLGLLLPL